MTSLHERLVSVPGSCPPGFGDSKTATTMLALHPKRAEKVDFVMYKAPSGDSAADKAICEEWMTRATFIEDDLRWLLQLPHDRCDLVYFEDALAVLQFRVAVVNGGRGEPTKLIF